MGNSAKEYLMQARRIETQIRNKQEERAWVYGIVTSTTGNLSGEVVSGSSGGDKMERLMAKFVDLGEEINSEINRLVDKRQEINALIDTVPDSDEMRVLRLRYVGVWDEYSTSTKYLTWDEIGKDIHSSAKTAQRIHEQALKTISEILKVAPTCP